ncbi:hypothetical protein CO180_03590 [candidate division WWE3 bacterium CG_4_9_14_3_um_filter_41_6]|uniref:Uncharacterized protein n=1 Tax=candidate division WWE3 bacterium CG_4_10_14_0_2_um_filter_41_14 TaxID=1975072 RepID=A0A2M7THE6_UNCKA|nr:MAG: hypothetical protein COY32_04865 [candidate division WWE3 bacterium CG_4_10_14_0_2_um_filter_41_14]PJA38417.1 MAG: hypothetical protein CO180_03590 [candidate division WWE3 bacterium CG_4_9_14_3_um_filter_41_6]
MQWIITRLKWTAFIWTVGLVATGVAWVWLKVPAAYTAFQFLLAFPKYLWGLLVLAYQKFMPSISVVDRVTVQDLVNPTTYARNSLMDSFMLIVIVGFVVVALLWLLVVFVKAVGKQGGEAKQVFESETARKTLVVLALLGLAYVGYRQYGFTLLGNAILLAASAYLLLQVVSVMIPEAKKKTSKAFDDTKNAIFSIIGFLLYPVLVFVSIGIIANIGGKIVNIDVTPILTELYNWMSTTDVPRVFLQVFSIGIGVVSAAKSLDIISSIVVLLVVFIIVFNKPRARTAP